MSIKTLIGTASAMAVLFAAPAALSHDTDDDDKRKVEKSYDFTGFDKIDIEGVYEVIVEVGPNFSIDTSGKAKRMDQVNIYLDGDTLVLGTKKNSGNRRGKNNGIKAVITMPDLTEINLEGVGSVEVEGIDADDFSAALEGVGSMELSGKCGDLRASVEGVGSLDARGLKCKDVNVDVEGIGSAEVYASDRVNANMEGMGSIDVWGKPGVVQKSKSFMSSVDIH